MKPVGSQLIAEFTHCSKKYLNDRNALEAIVKEGIEKCGLGLISIKGHQFDPVGVTVIAVISESHIAIHTYPEALHASIDIFTCASGSKSVSRMMNFLKSRLRPKKVRLVELLRGNPIEIKKRTGRHHSQARTVHLRSGIRSKSISTAKDRNSSRSILSTMMTLERCSFLTGMSR